MSKAIDKFKDYSDTFNTVKIHVDELDLDVYVQPITLLQRSQLLRKSEGMDNIKTSLEAIVMLALDEKGKPLFTAEDKPTLLRLGGADAIVSKLFSDIMEAHTVSDPLELSEATTS